MEDRISRERRILVAAMKADTDRFREIVKKKPLIRRGVMMGFLAWLTMLLTCLTGLAMIVGGALACYVKEKPEYGWYIAVGLVMTAGSMIASCVAWSESKGK